MDRVECVNPNTTEAQSGKSEGDGGKKRSWNVAAGRGAGEPTSKRLEVEWAIGGREIAGKGAGRSGGMLNRKT